MFLKITEVISNNEASYILTLVSQETKSNFFYEQV